MSAQKNSSVPQTTAFYHSDGFIPAWEHTQRYIGDTGRIATMPDIVAARLATKPGDPSWERYFTTLSAEYLGFSRAGNRILIVAHGVGPMATRDGILNAYSWEYKDKTRDRRGGRITQEEFLALESGRYGYVHIIDFDAYCRMYEYPFSNLFRLYNALQDPLLLARLGPQAENYLIACAKQSQAWHAEQINTTEPNTFKLPDHEQYLQRRCQIHTDRAKFPTSPRFIELQGASNCSYTFGPRFGHRPIEDDLAIAHLLTTSRLVELKYEGEESLVHDIYCHEWWNGTRLVGIPEGADARNGIHPGPDARKLLWQHWEQLFIPVDNPQTVGFRPLIQIGENWFTQYPKAGDNMDTWEPEFRVTEMKPLWGPVPLRTPVIGYYGFFTYTTQEIQALAPPGANAYTLVGEPDFVPKSGGSIHQCLVQFYRVQVDNSRQLIRQASLEHDYDKMMELVESEA